MAASASTTFKLLIKECQEVVRNLISKCFYNCKGTTTIGYGVVRNLISKCFYNTKITNILHKEVVRNLIPTQQYGPATSATSRSVCTPRAILTHWAAGA